MEESIRSGAEGNNSDWGGLDRKEWSGLLVH